MGTIVDTSKVIHSLTLLSQGQHGECTEDTQNFLQRKQLQEAHAAQSYPIQNRKSVRFCSRKEALRPEAEWIRRSDEAYLPQKGQDYKKNRTEDGVYGVQAA